MQLRGLYAQHGDDMFLQHLAEFENQLQHQQLQPHDVKRFLQVIERLRYSWRTQRVYLAWLTRTIERADRSLVPLVEQLPELDASQCLRRVNPIGASARCAPSHGSGMNFFNIG